MPDSCCRRTSDCHCLWSSRRFGRCNRSPYRNMSVQGLLYTCRPVRKHHRCNRRKLICQIGRGLLYCRCLVCWSHLRIPHKDNCFFGCLPAHRWDRDGMHRNIVQPCFHPTSFSEVSVHGCNILLWTKIHYRTVRFCMSNVLWCICPISFRRDTHRKSGTVTIAHRIPHWCGSRFFGGELEAVLRLFFPRRNRSNRQECRPERCRRTLTRIQPLKMKVC